MFDLTNLVKDQQTKKILLVFGILTAGLVMIHYYHQIKLTKLRIENLEETNEDKS